MPDRQANPAVDNETRFGTRRSIQKHGWVAVDAPAGYVSGFVMQDINGISHYVWMTTAGALRHGTTEPTTPETDGAAV